jgi:hypothetical protein
MPQLDIVTYKSLAFWVPACISILLILFNILIILYPINTLKSIPKRSIYTSQLIFIISQRCILADNYVTMKTRLLHPDFLKTRKSHIGIADFAKKEIKF